jgi:hypothetical protein
MWQMFSGEGDSGIEATLLWFQGSSISRKNWKNNQSTSSKLKDFQEQNRNPDLQKKNDNHMTLVDGMG